MIHARLPTHFFSLCFGVHRTSIGARTRSCLTTGGKRAGMPEGEQSTKDATKSPLPDTQTTQRVTRVLFRSNKLNNVVTVRFWYRDRTDRDGHPRYVSDELTRSRYCSSSIAIDEYWFTNYRCFINFYSHRNFFYSLNNFYTIDKIFML